MDEPDLRLQRAVLVLLELLQLVNGGSQPLLLVGRV